MYVCMHMERRKGANGYILWTHNVLMCIHTFTHFIANKNHMSATMRSLVWMSSMHIQILLASACGRLFFLQISSGGLFLVLVVDVVALLRQFSPRLSQPAIESLCSFHTSKATSVTNCRCIGTRASNKSAQKYNQINRRARAHGIQHIQNISNKP